MKKPEKIQKMFNEIAWKYDVINELISFGMHKRAKKESLKLLSLKSDDKILDICTGTGDLAYFMNKINPDCEITGIDFSEKMLEIAKKKNRKNKNTFILTDCTNLPFEDASFDVVTTGFGLRNVEDFDKAIFEIKRVLKPSGTLLHLDFSCGNSFFNKIFDLLIPILIKLTYSNTLPYEYLVKSKKEFINVDKRIAKIEENEFTFIKKKSFAFGVVSVESFEKK